MTPIFCSPKTIGVFIRKRIVPMLITKITKIPLMTMSSFLEFLIRIFSHSRFLTCYILFYWNFVLYLDCHDIAFGVFPNFNGCDDISMLVEIHGSGRSFIVNFLAQ